MAVHIHLDTGGGGGEGGTTDYEQLENRPQIDGHELNKETTSEELGLATKEYVERIIEEIDPPKPLKAGERITIDEEGYIHADKQLHLVDEWIDEEKGGGAVVLGGEGAGNDADFKIGCVVEGRNNRCNLSTCIHVEGKDNMAYGMGSHTEGTGNVNRGNFSHVEGSGNKVYGKMMHVFGRNACPIVGGGIDVESDSDQEPSDTYSDYVEVVGNGPNGNINRRSNARMLKWNGDEWLAGHLYLGSNSGRFPDEGTQRVATEKYVMEQLENFHPAPSPDETLELRSYDSTDISKGDERDVFGNPYKVYAHQAFLSDAGLDADKLEKLSVGYYKRIAFDFGNGPLVLAITGHYFRSNTEAAEGEYHVVTAGDVGSCLLKLRWGDTPDGCLLWWTESVLFDE